MSLTRGVLLALAVLAGLTVHAAPQVAPPFDESLLKAFVWRNTGPFRMQARIAAIAVPESPARAHLDTFYVAPWIGGLFKTTNTGTTFEPVFDGQDNLSIGAVALAPSKPDTVWVGTGDAFTSRSSYAGDGVYKSIDAGKTWRNMGLADSQHIARIVIHPTNPDVVYVAAMGHLYSTNSERGVYKTTDGGVHWSRVLGIDDRVGIIDLVMHPTDPSVLYAAAYDKARRPWQIVNGGPESGIYKTIDAGRTWTKLGGGLPTGRIGRIGLAQYLAQPRDSSTPSSRTRIRGPCRWRRHPDAADHPGAERGVDDRRRGVPHGQRRPNVDENEPGRLQRESEGPVLFQPDFRRSQRRAEHLRHAGRLPALDRRRPDVERAARVPADVRRRPHALDRSPQFRSHDPGQRRRHRAVVRRREDERRPVEHAARVGVHARDRHGGALQHLRGPPGPRALEGAVERATRPRDGAGLARRRRRRRHLHVGRSERQPLALHHPRVRVPHALRSEAGVSDLDPPAAAGRRTAVPLPVGAADRRLAAPERRDLHRRADAVAIGRSGRPLDRDQP